MALPYFTMTYFSLKMVLSTNVENNQKNEKA
jgi:hypothetical protein